MSRPEARRHRLRGVRAVAIVAGLLAGPLAWVAMPATDSGAQTPEPRVVVETSGTSDVTDGQPVEITVRPGRTGITMVGAGEAKVCRDGVPYTETVEGATLIDFSSFRGEKCAEVGGTAMSPASVNGADLHLFPDGSLRGSINVGVGSTTWRGQSGDQTLACGPDRPCRLVIMYRYRDAGGPQQFGLEASTLLTYLDPEGSATPGCAGAEVGSVRSVGTERMRDAWAVWTRASCEARGAGALAPTLSALSDERSGLDDFAAGGADLVYSATGYPSPLAEPSVARSYIATPVALNAVVLAVAGGHDTLTPDLWPRTLPQPFSDVKLTIGEVAALIGQSPFVLSGAYPEVQDAVMARNPELAILGANYCCTMPNTLPLIPGTPDSRTLEATTLLDALAPDAWRNLAGTPRGVTADFSASDPGFDPAHADRYTNGSSLEKSVFGIGLRTPVDRYGAVWALTDYASAVQLGMTPVAIQFEAGGEFITPTPETIAAGAERLSRQPDGTRAPDPTNLSAGAYPLAMVEYAFAPSEPLPAERCASPAHLVSWLRYVTGDGQQVMPEGMMPLTASLASDAAAAVDQIAAIPAPECPTTAPTTPPTTPQAAPTPLGGANWPDAGSGSYSGSPADAGEDTELASAAAATSDSRDAAADIAEQSEIEMPPFLGVKAFSEVASPLALLLVVLLTSGAALATSGRPLPTAVAQAPGRVGRRLGRLRPRRRRAASL